MGTLLDAYALIALLREERAAAHVELILRRGDASITSLNLAESLDLLERIDGIGEATLRPLIEPLALPVVPVTEALAWRAAALRATHYRRRQSEVSLADCCLVGAATTADRIATADRAVLEMARREGVAVEELG